MLGIQSLRCPPRHCSSPGSNCRRIQPWSTRQLPNPGLGACRRAPAGVFSPQDAVDFAQRELAAKGNDAKQTCNRLIYEAIRERRCKDNCTVMLVQLQQQ